MLKCSTAVAAAVRGVIMSQKREIDRDQNSVTPTRKILEISDVDRAAALGALIDPPLPNALLLRAMRDHKLKLGPL